MIDDFILSKVWQSSTSRKMIKEACKALVIKGTVKVKNGNLKKGSIFADNDRD